MRIAVFLACLFLTGCGDILFTETIATKEDSFFDPSLLGTWFDQDDTVLTVTGENRPGYEILVINAKNGNQLKLVAQYASYGDRQILEVSDAEAGIFSVQAHIWVNVLKKANGIQIQYLDSKWLQEKATQNGLQMFTADGHPVVTAPAVKLREFAKEFGLQPEARGSVMDLIPFKKK